MAEPTIGFNGNGWGKPVLAIGCAGLLALVAWNFAAVVALQVAVGHQDERISALHADLDFVRQNDTSFQTEIRQSISQSQIETRQSIAQISNILTELRTNLHDTLDNAVGARGAKH